MPRHLGRVLILHRPGMYAAVDRRQPLTVRLGLSISAVAEADPMLDTCAQESGMYQLAMKPDVGCSLKQLAGAQRLPRGVRRSAGVGCRTSVDYHVG